MQPFHVTLVPDGIKAKALTSSSKAAALNLTSTAAALNLTSTAAALSLTSKAFSSGGGNDGEDGGGRFLAKISLAVHNRYDHVDMDSLWDLLAFDWQLEADGVVVARGEDLSRIPSHSPLSDPDSKDGEKAVASGDGGGGERGGWGRGEVATVRVEFEAPAAWTADALELWLTVTGRLRKNAPWAAAGHVVGHTQLELPLAEVWRGVVSRTSERGEERARRTKELVLF